MSTLTYDGKSISVTRVVDSDYDTDEMVVYSKDEIDNVLHFFDGFVGDMTLYDGENKRIIKASHSAKSIDIDKTSGIITVILRSIPKDRLEIMRLKKEVEMSNQALEDLINMSYMDDIPEGGDNNVEQDNSIPSVPSEDGIH